jgi:hypothetical protein
MMRVVKGSQSRGELRVVAFEHLCVEERVGFPTLLVVEVVGTDAVEGTDQVGPAHVEGRAIASNFRPTHAFDIPLEAETCAYERCVSPRGVAGSRRPRRAAVEVGRIAQISRGFRGSVGRQVPI